MLLLFAGRLVEGGHSNDSDNSHARDNEESQNRCHAQRTSHMVPSHKGNKGIGQGMVHVSDQHGSHEEPSWVSGCGW